MARMYSRHKGRHGSKHFPVKRAPKWMKHKSGDVIKFVIELAQKKYTSAMIGTILRDQYGVPDVKVMTGRTIAKIMKENKLYPGMPEDIMSMLRKAVGLHDHLRRNKNDRHSLRSLQNLESKIRRLAKFYKEEKLLPKDWVYSLEKARLVVQR